MHAQHVLPRLFRPYFLLELPGWGHLYRLLGIHGKDNTDPRWRAAPTVECRGKNHGFKMRLRLSDDIDRDTYFLGRYYDLQLQLLLDELLGRGDTFLDIGANVGRTTLHGASRVGETGRVIAIEPQPECCARIREAIDDNALGYVEVHDVAAGEREEELELKILGGGTIMASLAIDEEIDGPTLRDTISVPVVRLDDLLAGDIIGNLVVKIDVEGFELYALRGLGETISAHEPAVVTEVAPRYLQRAGVDGKQLFTFFQDRGYTGYVIALGKTRFRRPKLALTTIASVDEIDVEADIVWIPPRSSFNASTWL